MASLLYNLTVLAVILSSCSVSAGTPLECYTCNSFSDPTNCPYEGFDPSTYTGANVTCSASSAATMQSVQSILYPTEHIEQIDTLSTSKITEDRCVKFTAKHPYSETSVTFRGCFLNGHYACRHIEGVLTQAGAILEQCDQCRHKFYCNSGHQNRISGMAIFSMSFVSLIVAKGKF